MPQNLSIAIFVLGAVLLLLSLVSGGFKIFGSEMPGAANRTARGAAFVIGLFLIGFALWHYSDAQKEAPSPAPAPAPQPGPPDPQPKPIAAVVSLNDAQARQTYGDEGTDFGVAPRNAVQQVVSAPTPTSIPGAKVITTGELKNAMDAGRSFVLVDVLTGLHQMLPNAVSVAGMGMPNPPINIPVILTSLTGGDKTEAIVFYCSGSRCWESYNAALRAKNAGFSNVYWYRGGLSAWGAASGYGN